MHYACVEVVLKDHVMFYKSLHNIISLKGYIYYEYTMFNTKRCYGWLCV
jgi:hypothetical protein